MELSIQNLVVIGDNDFKQIRLLASAGFKNIDWDLKRYFIDSKYFDESIADANKYYTKLRKYVDKCGVKITQTHTLFPTYMDEKNELHMFAGLENCFIATSLLGAKYMVVHPMMQKEWEGEENRELRIKKNIKFFNEIAPLAEKYDVKICIENMLGYMNDDGTYNETACSRYEDMLAIIGGVEDRSSFSICYDSGHANIVYKDEAVNEIRALADDIKVLHLHDNFGKVDEHNLPGEGTINWDNIMQALSDIKYQGYLNFELSNKYIKKLNKKKSLIALRERLESFISKYNL